MITEVRKAIADVVRYGPAEQNWFEHREIINEMQQGNHRARRRNARRNGENSGQRWPGDDKIRFVLQDVSDVTSCIAGKMVRL